MELLILKPAQGIKVSELERLLRGTKDGHTKSQNDPRRQYKNNKDLDIKRCSNKQLIHLKPTPCKCPTHHRPIGESPNIIHNNGCRFKTKTQRFFLSQNGPTIEQSKQSRKWRGNRRSVDFQRHKRGDSGGKIINETNTHKSSQFQTQPSQLQNSDETDQIVSMRVLNMSRQLSSLANEISNEKVHDEQTTSRYLKILDSVKYKYNQVTKYLSNKGYSSEIQLITDLLARVFSDMKNLQQKCRKLCQEQQSAKNQLLRKRLLEKMRSSKTPTTQPKELLKESLYEQKVSEKDKTPQSNQTGNLISQADGNLLKHTSIREVKYTHRHSLPATLNVISARKFRYVNRISLNSLLGEFETGDVDVIAHASTDELVEGLEFIENQLNAELIKSSTTKQVPEYVKDHRTSNFVQRILTTVENSSRLSSYDIMERSVLLQGGLRKIYQYESQIKNKALQMQLVVQQHSDNKNERPHSYRNIALDIQPSQLETIEELQRNSLFIKDSKGIGKGQEITQSLNMNISNRVFSKNKAIEHEVMTQLTAAGSTFFQKNKNASHKRRRSYQNSQQQYINGKRGGLNQNRTSKRRKGLKRITIKREDLNLKYKGSSSEDGDNASLGDIWQNDKVDDYNDQIALRYAKSSHKKHKIQNILKDINHFLIDKNLEKFIIQKEDNKQIRRKKLGEIKKLIEQQPEHNRASLLKSIKQYENYQRFIQQSEHEKSSQHNTHNGHLVLESILSSIKDGVSNNLKWTDDILKVQRRNEEKNLGIDEYDKYLKEPLNTRTNEQRKFHARIRQQCTQLKKKNISNQKVDDLGQAGPSHWSSYENVCRQQQLRRKETQTGPINTHPTDSRDRLCNVFRYIHRNHPSLFNDLLHNQFMSS